MNGALLPDAPLMFEEGTSLEPGEKALRREPSRKGNEAAPGSRSSRESHGSTTAEWLDALEDLFEAEGPRGRAPARTPREYAACAARISVQELRQKVIEFDAAVRDE